MPPKKKKVVRNDKNDKPTAKKDTIDIINITREKNILAYKFLLITGVLSLSTSKKRIPAIIPIIATTIHTF